MNRRRGRRKTWLFALPLAVLLAVLWADPAFAHTRLVKTTPADGTQITAAPAAVSLTFSGKVLKLGATVKVSGPGGSANMGAARLHVTTVSWPVTGDLASGKYNVSWRVTAADGHPIDGKFDFVLQAPKPTGTSSPAAVDPTPTSTPHTAEPQMTGPMPGMEGMPGMGAQAPPGSSTESATTTGFAIAGLVLLTAIVTGAIVIERRRRPRPAEGPSELSTD